MQDDTVPESIRSGFNNRLDLLLEEGIAQLQLVLQRGLRRNLTAEQMVEGVNQAFGEFSQKVSSLAAYYYAQSSCYQLLKCYADSGADQFTFLVEKKEGTCSRCSSLEGKIYTLEELTSQHLLPPLHPNCGCSAVPAIALTGEGLDESTGLWEPLRRIPADAKAMILGYADAQYANFKNIAGVGDFLNYLLLGVPGSMEEGLKARADAMFQDPNWYTIGNWLTLGFFDLVKGTFFPDEPLSLEHWLNALGLVSSVYGMYKTIHRSANGYQQLSGEKTVSRPSWRQSEKDVAKMYPKYNQQVSFLNGKVVPYGTKGSSRPDFYRNGTSIEVKNYAVLTESGKKSLVQNISKQVRQRVVNLPAGTKQVIIIDVRGQTISHSALKQLRNSILEKCSIKVTIKFMR